MRRRVLAALVAAALAPACTFDRLVPIDPDAELNRYGLPRPEPVEVIIVGRRAR